jgi:hypothetical protein
MVFSLLALLCCVRVHHERISAYFYRSLHTFILLCTLFVQVYIPFKRTAAYACVNKSFVKIALPLS